MWTDGLHFRTTLALFLSVQKQMTMILFKIKLNRFCHQYWKRTLPLHVLQADAPLLHQRPPSVGMPRHAFRRRMANKPQVYPRSCARCRCYPTKKYFARLWVGSRARYRVPILHLHWTPPTENDLENYPTDFAEIWHTAPLEHSKNKFPLAFCWEKSKCWSKMRF